MNRKNNLKRKGASNIKGIYLAIGGAFFIFLGLLFGNQILAFIFGFLGPNTISLPQDTYSVINETGAINSTGYTLEGASAPGANTFTITQALNATDGAVIGLGNLTVSSTGVVTNATATIWSSALLTYNYLADSNASNILQENQEDSLAATNAFAGGSDSVSAIIIAFIVIGTLVCLFLLFKGAFMPKSKRASQARASLGTLQY